MRDIRGLWLTAFCLLHPSHRFISERYGIDFNAAMTSQLNRSIKSGAGKGTFMLPKGELSKPRGNPVQFPFLSSSKSHQVCPARLS